MCGITGLISDHLGHEDLAKLVDGMAAQLVHRGPDDGGRWIDPPAGVALGHRRLSIFDLSDAGHQPMVSASNRYVISYNGEVYNFRALRKELESLADGRPPFQGSSDTEVVLAAIESWGLEEAVRRFVGMFAFALWDRHQRVLHLVRDRIGEKPLYYGWLDRDFVFASELRALRAHPAWTGEVDRNALGRMMRYGYVPSPFSICRNVFKLPPGSMLTLNCSDAKPVPRVTQYWSARDFFETERADAFCGDETAAVERLEGLLCEAIGDQMRADVPLGAFLSGGVDSTLLVALMRQLSSRPVESFTIGFRESKFNEAVQAKQVAQYLGTNHTELYVSPQNALDAVQQMPTVYDEPFADPSQIPTYLLARLTRAHVTVSLSGDGADELFGGYRRYVGVPAAWQRRRRLRPVTRQLLAKLLQLGLPATKPMQRYAGSLLPNRFRTGDLYNRVRALAQTLGAKSPDQFYEWTMSHWKDPAAVVLGCDDPAASADDASWGELADLTPRMMFRDLLTYLPDDILVKVDRASMAVSLESRAPFLDHRVVQFALQLPASSKVRGDSGKCLLRRLLYKHVPRELVERPKQGFAAPIAAWMRGPLREWAEALLDPQRLRQEGYFDPRVVRRKWSDHVSGASDRWNNDLWSVLMFQSWLENSSCPLPGVSRLVEPPVARIAPPSSCAGALQHPIDDRASSV